MLTIVCGEDSVAARSHYRRLIDEAREKNLEISMIAPAEVATLIQGGEAAVSLFGHRQFYATQGLNKQVGRGAKDALLAHLRKIADAPDVDLVTFEDGVGGYELKLRTIGVVKEFKPSGTIFKLLDQLYPKNLSVFCLMLEALTAPEIFILVMVQRHVRKLLLISSGGVLKGVPAWQAANLRSQAQRWEAGNLASFYDALLRLELAAKSGRSVLGPKKSIEVAAAYFL